ncbi:MAG: SRPBCC family protein [Hyphomicrobiaceae bacterium]|nr:SRPBCC family protein [Hyphomicrobiaceae bacterium]
MATVRKEIITKASLAAVWDALRDVGAPHIRMVPGFLVDTKLEPGLNDGDRPIARTVTFGNGVILREPIIAIDEVNKRVVWSAEGGTTTHYNSSVIAIASPEGTRVIWTSDFLPDSATPAIDAAMTMGSRIMKRTLDKLPN